VEASFTDWIVVYMRRARHMDPSTAGYSSSIFWIGMTAGRYALGPVSERFGVGQSVTIYIIFAMCTQVGLGLVRDTLATFLFLALNGFLIAPLFPSGIVVLVARVAPQSQLTVVAIAIAVGQLGAAAAPLGVGLMATKLGMHHLIEVICGLSVLLLLAWGAFIRIR
jgi:fucose permease